MKGSILLEVIMAIGITGVMLVTLYLGMLYAFKVNQKARNATLAYHILEQEMEILRSASPSLVDQENGPFHGDIEGLNLLPNGQGLLTITNYNGDASIKQVTMTVSWDDPDASHRSSRVLETLVTDGGLQTGNTWDAFSGV